MDLFAMQLADNRRNLKTTVLHRPGGQWLGVEISRLVGGLNTEVSQHPQHPEYVIIFGHFTKEQTLRAIRGGIAYTATAVTGVDELPYLPGFI